MGADGNNAIKGAGGGGGGGSQRTPVEAPDSLNSVAHAHILDLWGEGEQAGFYSDNPLKDVALDETPVMNADGTLNFTDVYMDWREGTNDQQYMKGFPSVANEIAVATELKEVTPWTKLISNIQLSAVRVRLSVAALSKTDTSTADINGHSVSYAIDLKVDDGAFIEVLVNAFTGKTNNKYERSHRIDLPPANASWTVRVRRLTADTEAANIQDTTFVESYTEIMDIKMRYPNSAYGGLRLDAAQFRSIPSRAYRRLGRIMRVPVNYDPITGVYTGMWNGTFKMAWTRNPAWIFYDLCTNTRFGLGQFVDESQIDKWALYQIAQYCDEMVPDGKGGTEPRFTCTVFLQTQQEAYKVLQDLASVFRGISYWGSGAIIPVSDMPRDPVYTYTNANVKDGIFSYQGSARRARHTVALVSWSDPTFFNRQKVEYVEDEEGIARYGIQTVQVTAVGCTSQGQAQRVGRWILLTEKMETDTVTFAVGLDGGMLSLPGQLINVADEKRAGRRIGGRVVTATASQVTVDQLPTVVIGDDLICILPNGTAQKRPVASIVGNTINVSPAFDSAPVPESIWAVESPSLKTQMYSVISVGEGEGLTAVITAIQHEPGKHAAVDAGTYIEPRMTTGMIDPAQRPPTNIVITAAPRAGEVIANTVVTATWVAPVGAISYEVQWRRNNGEWSSPQRVIGNQAEFFNAFPGDYVCKVSARNGIGIVSIPAVSETFTVADQSMMPGFAAALEADIATAMGVAQDALDTANAVSDGGIMSYFQDDAPTGLAAEDVGDIWFDTNDNNKIWRWSGSAWLEAPDSRIAIAIAAAADAQATADGKVKTFAQNDPPSATGVGDLWIDLNDGNKLYRATAVGTGGWVLVQDTGIGAALAAAANAQAAADGAIISFWQDSPPVIGAGAGQASVGDIWFDTNDGNRIWRVVGGAWVDAQDDALANALAAASTAQATADGKVKTFFQADEIIPTASGIGDLWFRTTSKTLKRWNGSTWADVDATTGNLAGNGTNQLWDEYTQFQRPMLPLSEVVGGSAIAVADSESIGGYSLRLTASNTDANSYMALSSSYATSIHPINGTNFIVSFYARASVSGHLVSFDLYEGATARASGSNVSITNTTGLTRYSFPITANAAMAKGNLIIRFNKSGVNGRQVHIDRLMIEPQIGTKTTPSPWTPGAAGRSAAAAATAAATAQATADGTVDIYRTASAPAFPPAKLGDYWQDTDDNKWYYSANGSSWSDVTDPRIPQAIADAAAANGNANTRIRTYYSSTTPTPSAVGDLWYNTTTGVLARWDGSAWANTADNSIAALNPNVQNPGFEQGLTGWTDPGYGITGWATTSPPVTPSGTKVMTKSGGVNGSSGLLNSANVAVTPGSRVVTRITAKADSNPAGGVEIGMAWYSGTGSLISWSMSLSDFNKSYCDGAWKEFIKVVTAPAGAVFGKMFFLVHGYTGAGSWSFDSVRADPLDDVSAGVNLLPNSEFIQGTTGWAGINAIATGADSTYAVSALVADNVQNYIYADITTDVTAMIGKRVTGQLEVAVTGTTTANTRAFLRIEAMNAGDSTIAYADSAGYGFGTGEIPMPDGVWNKLVAAGLVIPVDTVKLRFLLVIRGSGTFRMRKPKFERGEFPTQYSPSADAVWGSQLVVPGSKRRLGDQRNLMQSLVNAYGAVSDAVPLTADSSGQVSINAFTVKMGGSSVSYSAVTNAVTGLTQGQTYAIYCFDAAFEGGVRTWYASNGTFASIMSLGDDIVIAGSVLIPASGTSSGGGGGGTPEDDPYCVHYDTMLPDGRYVRDLKIGDMVTCIDVHSGEVGDFPVLDHGLAKALCYRLITPELCSVVQSIETAMNIPDGRVVKTPHMTGKEVYVCADGVVKKSLCMDVEFLGIQPVVKIDLGDRMFFAGESSQATIATHNIRFKP